MNKLCLKNVFAFSPMILLFLITVACSSNANLQDENIEDSNDKIETQDPREKVTEINFKPITTKPSDLELTKFKNKEDLLDYFKTNTLESFYYYQTRQQDDLSSVSAADISTAESAGTITLSADSSDSRSGTNLQDKNIDESDTVKSNEKYIFAIAGSKVNIIDTQGLNMSLIKQIDIVHQIDEIFLHGDQLIILYNIQSEIISLQEDFPLVQTARNKSRRTSAMVYPNYYESSGVCAYNINNPASPNKIFDYQFDANFITTRILNSKLYVIMNGRKPAIKNLTFAYKNEEELNIIKEQNKSVVEQLTLKDFLPSYYSISNDGEKENIGQIADYKNTYRTGGLINETVSTISYIDLKDPKGLENKFSLLNRFYEIYMSQDNIYPIYSNYYSNSHIWKISIQDKYFKAKGVTTLEGRIINRYTVNEYNGILRVATNDFNNNRFYNIGEKDGEFKIISGIENIAPGENLHSARFIEDRGYMVTFKKVDPFFTIDLSDVDNPTLKGELKIPGFSDYLHPMDKDHILAIGNDTDDQGSFAWFRGIQLSIFNVSDFSNPILLHKEVIGTRGTNSEAKYQPKAFNYWAHKEQLAIPINLYEGGTGSTYGQNTFNGMYLYHLNPTVGFQLKGRVPLDTSYGDFFISYYSNYSRSIMTDDYLYSISNIEIKKSNLIQPSQVIDHVRFESK